MFQTNSDKKKRHDNVVPLASHLTSAESVEISAETLQQVLFQQQVVEQKAAGQDHQEDHQDHYPHGFLGKEWAALKNNEQLSNSNTVECATSKTEQ